MCSVVSCCAFSLLRHNLEQSLLQGPWDSMKSADVVLVMVDVADFWTRNCLSHEVLQCLFLHSHVPSVLVMNKVDLVKKKGILLEVTNQLTEGIVNRKKAWVKSVVKPSSDSEKKPNPHGQFEVKAAPSPELEPTESPVDPEMITHSVSGDTPDPMDERKQALKNLKNKKGWPQFQEVFMLSAMSGGEVQMLKRYLLTLAKPRDWEFHSDVVTTQSPEEICDNIIREKLLENLPQEVPYNVTQITELWEEGPGGELVILQTLLVLKESHVKMLIGPGGKMISKIAQDAGRDLMDVFLCDVRLRLAVKVKK
ncbi:hypothetical protein FKM82_021194 [Ascaphus truei]